MVTKIPRQPCIYPSTTSNQNNNRFSSHSKCGWALLSFDLDLSAKSTQLYSSIPEPKVKAKGLGQIVNFLGRQPFFPFLPPISPSFCSTVWRLPSDIASTVVARINLLIQSTRLFPDDFFLLLYCPLSRWMTLLRHIQPRHRRSREAYSNVVTSYT